MFPVTCIICIINTPHGCQQGPAHLLLVHLRSLPLSELSVDLVLLIGQRLELLQPLELELLRLAGSLRVNGGRRAGAGAGALRS